MVTPILTTELFLSRTPWEIFRSVKCVLQRKCVCTLASHASPLFLFTLSPFLFCHPFSSISSHFAQLYSCSSKSPSLPHSAVDTSFPPFPLPPPSPSLPFKSHTQQLPNNATRRLPTPTSRLSCHQRQYCPPRPLSRRKHNCCRYSLGPVRILRDFSYFAQIWSLAQTFLTCYSSLRFS